MPVILSLGALVVAVVGAVLAHRHHQDLERRLEAAIRETDQRLTAVCQSADRIDAWVRASVAESHAEQRQSTADTLSQWSADVIADVDALLESFRSAVKADAAALVGQALAEYEGLQARGEGSSCGQPLDPQK